jgi:hypothetical protein
LPEVPACDKLFEFEGGHAMIRLRQIAVTSACVAGLVACSATTPDGGIAADPYEGGRTKVADCAATQCTRLDLDGVMLEDYTVLNEMTHITALMMSYSSFADLRAIAGMTQLTELHIGFTEVADLSGLAAFSNLTLLHAQNLSNVTDYSPVGRVRSLEELAIGDYGFDQVAVVRDLPRLQRLLIEVAVEADLSPMRAHPRLEVVDLGFSNVSDISVLTTLPRLRELGVASLTADPTLDATVATLTARGVSVEQRDVMIVC